MKKERLKVPHTIAAVCISLVWMLSNMSVAMAADLSVNDFTLLSSRRISRTVYEYTYTARAINDGTVDYSSVAATVTSNSAYTVVVDAQISFPDIGAGTSVACLDTFSFQQNRRYPFDWSNLTWAVTGTPQDIPQPVTINGMVVGGTPMVGTVNIKDSSDPPLFSYSAIGIDGSYTIDIDSDWQPPFLMWADGWVGDLYMTMFSYVDLGTDELSSTANITPATTAIVASAMDAPAEEIDPVTALVPATTDVAAAKAQVQIVLENFFSEFNLPPSFDLIESPIALGEGSDLMFDAFSFSTDADDNVVVASKTDPSVELVITEDTTPDEGAALAADAQDALAALEQFRDYFTTLYDLYSVSPPTIETLQTTIQPFFADGIVTNGLFGVDETLEMWAADPTEASPIGIEYVSCSIVRPMRVQDYGSIQISEMPDSYLRGVWVNLTYRLNGRLSSYLTSFVEIGEGDWRMYGNRCPFKSRHYLRARSEKTITPIGNVVYEHGLIIYIADIANSALTHTGLTNLAIFNAAMPPENIDGSDTNCLRMARQYDGLSTEFGITNVPGQYEYQIYFHYGDGSINDLNLSALASQTDKEFVMIGLNDANQPVYAWLQLLSTLPPDIDELMALDNQYFATIQAPVTFSDIEELNEIAVQWDLPLNNDLIPSFSKLAWYNYDWLFQEIYKFNPAHYGPGDFSNFTEAQHNAIGYPEGVRKAHAAVMMESPTNQNQFRVIQEYNPWAEEAIEVRNGQLCMDVAKAYTADMLSHNLEVRLRATDRSANRIEAEVIVEDIVAMGSDTNLHAAVWLLYQPDEHWRNGDLTDLFIASASITYRDGNLFSSGFAFGSRNADGSDSYSTPDPIGSYPYNAPVAFGEAHTLAAEYDAATHCLRIEFDGQSSAFDMSVVPEFNPTNFKAAEIRARVRAINAPGDSGRIRSCFDNVRLDGVLFDDFNSGIGVNKWWVRADE